MDNGLRRYTADEIQAALGDNPFVVRGLWPGVEAVAKAPPASPSPPDEPPFPAPVVELARAEPRGLPVALRPAPVPGAEAFRPAPRPRPHRWPAPRRWPLVLLLTGTALSAACVAVWMMPPSPPAQATVRPVPAPLMLAATAAAPEPWPASKWSAPPASESAPGSAAEAPPPAAVSDARPPPAEPPLPAPAPAAPEAAAPVVSAVAAAPPPVAAPNAPRASDPVLAAALLRRAEAALARGDVAAARAFFVRAASVDSWSVEAMVGAGKTYDPAFLHPLGATGGLADRAEARRWYGRAAQLGDAVAAGLAERLGDGR